MFFVYNLERVTLYQVTVPNPMCIISKSLSPSTVCMPWHKMGGKFNFLKFPSTRYLLVMCVSFKSSCNRSIFCPSSF